MTIPMILLALVVIPLLLTGCRSGGQSAPPAADGRPRRATAAELVAAAQTGVVPDWFSPAEREAVDRIRQ